jgi:hypothetical protein
VTRRKTRPAFTKIPDWIMLCDRLTPTAFRLWCILRALKFELGPGKEIPPLTLDQVCWLLPGVNGKPSSKTRVREALDCLLAEGVLIDLTDGAASSGAACRYDVLDEPQNAMGWTGARRKLAAYVKTWRKTGNARSGLGEAGSGRRGVNPSRGFVPSVPQQNVRESVIDVVREILAERAEEAIGEGEEISQ